MATPDSAPELGRLLLLGYGGADPEDFFARITTLAPDLALDVRLIPYGWHARYRGQLFLQELRAAGARSARWSHRLGNLAKRDGGPMRLEDPAAVADVVAVLQTGRNVLLICGCAKEAACHRLFIAQQVQEHLPALVVETVPPVPPRPRVRRRAVVTDAPAVPDFN